MGGGSPGPAGYPDPVARIPPRDPKKKSVSRHVESALKFSHPDPRACSDLKVTDVCLGGGIRRWVGPSETELFFFTGPEATSHSIKCPPYHSHRHASFRMSTSIFFSLFTPHRWIVLLIRDLFAKMRIPPRVGRMIASPTSRRRPSQLLGLSRPPPQSMCASLFRRDRKTGFFLATNFFLLKKTVLDNTVF